MGKSEQHFYSNYIVICRLNDLRPSAEDSLKYIVMDVRTGPDRPVVLSRSNWSKSPTSNIVAEFDHIVWSNQIFDLVKSFFVTVILLFS